MIIIRNVFQLKFGKAREAVALVKEGVAIQKRVGTGVDFATRVLTDVTGPFYTLVWEISVPNLAAFETAAPQQTRHIISVATSLRDWGSRQTEFQNIRTPFRKQQRLTLLIVC